MSRLIVRFDGSCGPKNPGGRMGWGFVVEQDGEVLHKGQGGCDPAPGNSNNVAEYRALLAAFEWLTTRGWTGREIEFRGDSKLVIQQMSGLWGIGRGLYGHVAHRAKATSHLFPGATYVWVPREENEAADALSRRSKAVDKVGAARHSRPRKRRDLEAENRELRRRVAELEDELASLREQLEAEEWPLSGLAGM